MAVFEQVDDWWIGYVEELPGANTQGETLEEARENLKDAVQLLTTDTESDLPVAHGDFTSLIFVPSVPPW